MNTEENDTMQSCDDCDAPVTTLQDIKDAVERLKKLAERFPDRILFHVIMETSDGAESANFGGSNLLEPKLKGNLFHLRWMAARGYMIQSSVAMNGSPAAIGKGIEFLIDRNNGKSRSGGDIFAAILNGIGED